MTSQQRKRGRTSSTSGINLGLIITPMLDMSFQILAFFIMTYHPSALEGHIPGLLAPSENPAVLGPNQPVVTPEIPLSDDAALLEQWRDVILINIKAIAPGQQVDPRKVGFPHQIFFQANLETKAELVGDVGMDFERALQLLERKLQDAILPTARHQTHLKIVADGELRQQYVLRTYDTCKKAGFTKIYFVPPPLLNAKR